MSQQRSAELSALDGSAWSKFEDAINRKAAVMAVENGHLSENEAIRWLKMDGVDRAQSPLGLPDGYRKRAFEELAEEWRQWYAV